MPQPLPQPRGSRCHPVASALFAAMLAIGVALPGTGHAREVSGSLTYRDRAALPEAAQVLIEVQNEMGDVVATARIDPAGRQVPLDFAVPDLPDAALRLRAAVFADGQPLRASAFQPIPASDADAVLGPVTLDPYIAMGFATRLRCGHTTVELGFVDDGARLRVGREVFDLAQVPAASGARFESPPDLGTMIRTQGDTAQITLRGRDLPECLPSVGTDLLPLQARATNATWSLQLGRDSMALRPAPDAVEITGLTPPPVAVPGDTGEISGYRFDLPDVGLRVLLRDLVCVGAGPLPRPVTVIVEEGGQMTEGCGGDPMALLTGGEWVVYYVGGTDIAPSLRVTMMFAEGRISGGSGCNRYSGGVKLGESGLSVAGLALTRRACPPARMQIEAQFMQHLSRAVGFTISGDGRLHLTDSSGTVLVSAQR